MCRPHLEISLQHLTALLSVVFVGPEKSGEEVSVSAAVSEVRLGQ